MSQNTSFATQNVPKLWSKLCLVSSVRYQEENAQVTSSEISRSGMQYVICNAEVKQMLLCFNNGVCI